MYEVLRTHHDSAKQQNDIFVIIIRLLCDKWSHLQLTDALFSIFGIIYKHIFA